MKKIAAFFTMLSFIGLSNGIAQNLNWADLAGLVRASERIILHEPISGSDDSVFLDYRGKGLAIFSVENWAGKIYFSFPKKGRSGYVAYVKKDIDSPLYHAKDTSYLFYIGSDGYQAYLVEDLEGSFTFIKNDFDTNIWPNEAKMYRLMNNEEILKFKIKISFFIKTTYNRCVKKDKKIRNYLKVF